MNSWRVNRHPERMQVRFFGGPWIDESWLSEKYPDAKRIVMMGFEETAREFAATIAIDWEVHLGER